MDNIGLFFDEYEIKINLLILDAINITSWDALNYFSCPSYFQTGNLFAGKNFKKQKN